MHFCSICGYSYDIKKKDELVVQFSCANCGHAEKIKPQTLLFSNIIDKSMDDMDEDISHYVYDNTLPRTRAYTCLNEKCISHKDPSKKEALFFRNKNSYKLTYMCVICLFKWENIE